MFKKKNTELAEVTEKKPKKKISKKAIKRIVIGGVVVVVAGALVLPNMFASEPLPMVQTSKATKEDIQQVVSTSGIVESDETKTFFADFTATITELNVEKGLNITAGEILTTFDTSTLESQYEQARLNQTASQAGYQSSLNKSGENATKFANASNDIEILEQQVEDYENYVTSIQQTINDETNALGDLEVKLGETKKEEKIKKYKQQIKEKQDYITDLNNELLSAQNDLSEFRSNLSEQESIKASSENGILNSNEKAQLAANNDITKLSEADAAELLEKAKQGISSDFDGIVTDVQVVEGATVTNGTALFTVANSEKVSLNVPLTKYDLNTVKEGQKATITLAGSTYEGTVEKISRVATTNSSGSQVINAKIHIDNPDENIYLGVEAKVSITVGTEKSVVVVPSECVNTDTKGDFCYIIENGVIVRKDIKAGLVSDEKTQIVTGLREGDSVVSSITGELVEGTAVTEMPNDASEEKVSEEGTDITSTEEAQEEAQDAETATQE